jgi:hypothetical protein
LLELAPLKKASDTAGNHTTSEEKESKLKKCYRFFVPVIAPILGAQSPTMPRCADSD